LSITELKGIFFHGRETQRGKSLYKETLATPARLGLDKGEASELQQALFWLAEE
jgi:hypothetical protein